MSPSQSGSYFSLPFVNCKFGKSGSYHSLTFLACNRVQLKFNLKLVSSDNFWFSREKSSQSLTLFLSSSAAERGFDSWLSWAQSAFKLDKFLRKKVLCVKLGHIMKLCTFHENGKNAKRQEIDSLYFVPDNFLFPNIFSSIFIKKGQIQQNFAPPYICWENTTKTVLLCEGWKYALSVQRMIGVFISDASELWTLKGRAEGL